MIAGYQAGRASTDLASSDAFENRGYPPVRDIVYGEHEKCSPFALGRFSVNVVHCCSPDMLGRYMPLPSV